MTHVVQVRLRQEKDYRFAIEFGAGVPVLVGDEPPPLGGGSGPSPVQLLAAAVGNCLSDSLHFALAKFKQEARGIDTQVTATIDRNAEGRLRVVRMQVEVRLGAAAAQLAHLERVLAQFEGFCTVAQSVGQGLPVEVAVYDGAGTRVK
ncbi:MAG: OsmC family protein [Burkholderiales bacterium]|nr:OsmC family protein [Burkholderiales bacterium]